MYVWRNRWTDGWIKQPIEWVDRDSVLLYLFFTLSFFFGKRESRASDLPMESKKSAQVMLETTVVLLLLLSLPEKKRMDERETARSVEAEAEAEAEAKANELCDGSENSKLKLVLWFRWWW